MHTPGQESSHTSDEVGFGQVSMWHLQLRAHTQSASQRQLSKWKSFPPHHPTGRAWKNIKKELPTRCQHEKQRRRENPFKLMRTSRKPESETLQLASPALQWIAGVPRTMRNNEHPFFTRKTCIPPDLASIESSATQLFNYIVVGKEGIFFPSKLKFATSKNNYSIQMLNNWDIH